MTTLNTVRADEARATLADEGCTHEVAVLVEPGGPFLVYAMEVEDEQRSRQAARVSQHPVDAEHRRVMQAGAGEEPRMIRLLDLRQTPTRPPAPLRRPRTLSFGYEGDDGLGDRLLAAALRGEKTATSSLAVEYLSGEALPRVGERLTLVDHAGAGHGTVESTRVTVIPLHLVGDDVALAEGEGFSDAAQWRRAHTAFWHRVTELVRADALDDQWYLRKTEPVVVHWFRLVGATTPHVDQ